MSSDQERFFNLAMFSPPDETGEPSSGDAEDVRLSDILPGQGSYSADSYGHAEPKPDSLFYRNTTDGRGRRARPSLAAVLGAFDVVGDEKAGARGEVLSLMESISERPSVATDGGAEAKGDGAAGKSAPATKKATGYQFGMWEGVFVRCLLNILGVIMFLRLSWITGNAGLGITCVIILTSAVVTSITTLSLSAVCTNGEVDAGGLYFMISRSLGAEFGGAIGITFYLANSISVALYVVGFGESVVLLMDGSTVANGGWDLRLFALLAMCSLTGVALTGGAKLEIMVQKVLLVVMVLSLLSFFIGCFLQGDDEDAGITGLDGGTFADNATPDFEDGVDWMTTFGVFFPAATGIMAGANISGDLKNPARAIPLGTLLAIGVSTVVYIVMAVLLASTVTRDTLVDFENVIAVVEVAAVPELVYAGIFAATLSSALAQLIGAPRILMAIAKDGIFPCLKPFAQGWGPKNEPLRGYVVTLAIAIAFTMSGDLNFISPLITNFFLLSYALVNYACCAATLSKSPGWRPGYRFWNPWVALLGAVLCFAIMLTWWIAAFATLVMCGALYKYIEFVGKPRVNWGSAQHATLYLKAVDGLHRLEHVPHHVKNFRPQYLVLPPRDTPPGMLGSLGIVQFVNQLSEGQGIVLLGCVLRGAFETSVGALPHYRELASDNLVEHGVRAFSECVIAEKWVDGVRSLMQICGVGKLRPNTAMIAFPEAWRSQGDELNDGFVDVVRSAFGSGLAVCVLRKADRLADMTSQRVEMRNAARSIRFKTKDAPSDPEAPRVTFEDSKMRTPPGSPEKARSAAKGAPPAADGEESKGDEPVTPRRLADYADFARSVTYQRGATRQPVIDVWWLTDDGGLTILLPFLLRQHHTWRGARMRMLTIASPSTLTAEQSRMTRLLAKFRIDAEVVVVDRKEKPPHQKTVERFERLSGSKMRDNSQARYILRLSDLVREKSGRASLVVVSLPIPRFKMDNRVWLSYIEMISNIEPPVLMLRGNHESVLTFYS